MPKGVGNNSGLRSCSRHRARPTTGFTRRPSAAGDPELRREDVSIAREADYIVARAIAEDAGVVSLGPLVFFSTATGDAWVLDAEDNLALQLAAAGTRLPFAITETRERFAIEWAGTFEIAGDLMTFADKAGKLRTVMGYPTREIAAALARARP
jgi:hypothetical protein